MPLEILSWINRVKGDFACVATYEFDPTFFERRILVSKGFEAASRIIVFVDHSRYQEILTQGLTSTQFNRRYFVIPIDRGKRVFHPKLVMTIGEQGAVALVGSNNCTASGTGHNMELASAFLWKPDGPIPSAQTDIIAAVFQLFRRYARDARGISQTLESECFAHISRLYPWLQRPVETHEASSIELLASHDDPLLPQVVQRLRGSTVQAITILAPFFDERAGLIERFRSLWPGAKISILAQPGYSNLPTNVISALKMEGAPIETFCAVPPLGRRLHAKAFAFETSDQTFWLTGSANASDPAFVTGNSEACLWFASDQSAAATLSHEDIKLSQIDPADFVPAATREPAPPEGPPDPLRLECLVLQDKDHLRVSFAAAPKVCNLTLELTRVMDQLPALSLPISQSSHDVVIELDEGKAAQFDRPIIGRLKGLLGTDIILSCPASVTLLPSLLRARGNTEGGGNQLRRIAETGEGLVEHLDTLGSVQEAVQFLNNVNIRFDDGAGFHGARSGTWRPRDPFSGDLPSQWELSTLTGSLEELRAAVWEFVQRHIRQKLFRHARRGNINGMPNFIDIFRTLNSTLLAYHFRKIDGQAIIPHPFVTKGMQEILATLIGPLVQDGAKDPGFVSTIRGNLRGDEDMLVEQLRSHKVAAMALASVEALIMVRAVALVRSKSDEWSVTRRAWVTNWIEDCELDLPDFAEVGAAQAELRVAA